MSFRSSHESVYCVLKRSGGGALMFSLLIIVGLSLISGCGGGGEDEVVLATVGTKAITADYYMEKLGKLKTEELPRDDSGNAVDTATEAGRLAFMDVLVNKELMVLKAYELGYDKAEEVEYAKSSLIDYHASAFMRSDEIDEPSRFVSEDEFNYYVERLGETRRGDFVICNFIEDALEAREMANTGVDWMEIVHKYHATEVRDNVEYKITVPWGKYTDSFERAVFDVAKGEVTEPIETQHGYWVIRVNNISVKPETNIEERKGEILASVQQRKSNLLLRDFIKKIETEHKLSINEDALWIVYQGLPEKEHILDPETNKPTPQEDLNELRIEPQHLDMVFYTYETLEGESINTIGDYKSHFDKMNAFQRPKASESLGSLRTKISAELGRIFMRDEGIRRGYLEDPRVLKELNKQIEQMIVSSLHQDVAQYESYVSPEDLDEYWAEHSEEYIQETTRTGNVVFCESSEKANEARQAAVAGTPWPEMLERFGTEKQNLDNKGLAGPYPITFVNPYKVALFELHQVGDVAQPFRNEGKWVVLKLTDITLEHQKELADVRESVGQSIKLERQDQKLNDILTEWRTDFPVDIDTVTLNEMPDFQACIARLDSLRMERARGNI